jgi:hypothetical protein
MIKLLHLVDNNLQSQTAAKCDLLIHIGIGKLQYAIIDKVRDELKALAEYELPEISNLTDLMLAIERLPETKRNLNTLSVRSGFLSTPTSSRSSLKNYMKMKMSRNMQNSLILRRQI